MPIKKFYQTMHIYSVNEEFRERYNIRPHARQFTIGCVTTSLKKANDWAELLGLGRNVFRRDFTFALEDRQELIEECEKKGGFVIATSSHGGEFVSIQEALRRKE